MSRTFAARLLPSSARARSLILLTAIRAVSFDEKNADNASNMIRIISW
jgi:hypothetical protein